METGDKLVTFDMAKELHDKVDGDLEDLKSAFDGVMEADETAEPVILEPTSTNYSATASATTMYISDRVIPAGSFISSIDIWARGAVKAVLINARNAVVKIFDIAEYGGLKSYKLNYYTSEDVRFGFIGLITFKGSITNADEAIATTGLYESTNVAPAVGDVLTINRSTTNLYRFCVQWKYSAFGLIGDLNEKADKVGVYPDLTAGTASQILSKTTVEDQVPYTFRQTGGGQSVGDRARLDKIVGGTVAWNQLQPDRVGRTVKNQYNAMFGTDWLYEAIIGHVYMVSFVQPAGCDVYRQVRKNFPSFFTVYPAPSVNTRISFMIKSVENGVTFDLNDSLISKNSTTETEYSLTNLQFFDLTQMFGSTIADYIYSLETATAGAGVAWFRQLFPLDYYDYNPGELISVSGVSARETVGFNAWDGTYDTRKTLIDSTTGEVLTWSSAYHASNYIDVIGGQTYYFNYPKALNSSRYGSAWYDADKNYISGFAHSSPVTDPIGLQTAPKNARYLRTTLTEEHLGTACISLSSSLNGTYEPYEKHTYPLDASLTLRGIPKLDAQNRLYWDGDEYTPDGKVTRNWGEVVITDAMVASSMTSDYTNIAYAALYLPNTASKTLYKQCLSSKYGEGINVYPFDTADAVGKLIINANAERWWVGFAAGTTLEQAKAQIVGTSILYELATPTTETAAEYQDIQIVDPYGTESFVTDGIVPVGHVTQYHENLREKIEQLPADFSTLIAPVEKTFVATRAYTSGALLIVNNVLYKATASIANGATITPGTNCTPTTLAAIIAALQ